MADDASDTVAGGIKGWLGTLGFILPLLGAEEVLRWYLTGSGHPLVGAVLVVGGLLFYLLPSMWRWIRGRAPQVNSNSLSTYQTGIPNWGRLSKPWRGRQHWGDGTPRKFSLIAASRQESGNPFTRPAGTSSKRYWTAN
jgi:hypothetical protein